MSFHRIMSSDLDVVNVVLMYHNCGNTVEQRLEQLAQMNADIYHFGISSNLKNISKICRIVLREILIRFFSEKIQNCQKRKGKNYRSMRRFDNFIFSTARYYAGCKY